MKKIYNLIRFQISSYIRTTYCIAPLIVLLLFLTIMYQQAPVEVMSSFSISALLVFVLMVWSSYSYVVHQNEVMSQLIELRINNRWFYETGQVLMQLVIAVVISFITIVFPLLKHLMSGGSLFLRPLTAADVIGAFIIIFAAGFLGGCLGRLFGPGVMNNGRMALLWLILFVMITVAKSGIIKWLPALRYVLWILPPVSDVVQISSVCGRYTAINVLAGLFLLCGYGILVSLLYTLIHKKKGFN